MSEIPVLELRLVALTTTEPLRVLVTPRFEGCAGAPVEVTEPLDAGRREDLRWYLEQSSGMPRACGLRHYRDMEALIDRAGHDLSFPLRTRGAADWWSAVGSAGRGRIEVVPDAPHDEIAFRLPWERLVRPPSGRLLHQCGVSVVRRVAAPPPPTRAGKRDDALSLLWVAPRPDAADPLDGNLSGVVIEAIHPRVGRMCTPPTFPGMSAALSARSWTVVHFDGHGVRGGNGPSLLFETEEGGAEAVPVAVVGARFGAAGVALAVLEACHSAGGAGEVPGAAAAQMVRSGVRAVLAMPYAVHDDMTRLFFGAFYRALAEGGDAVSAASAGRRAAAADMRRRSRAGMPPVEVEDWFVPQLYLGAVPPPRFLPGGARDGGGQPPAAGLPDPPEGGLVGRERDLTHLLRLIRRDRTVLVHGMAGEGKTALVGEAARRWHREGRFPGGVVFVSLEASPGHPAHWARLAAPHHPPHGWRGRVREWWGGPRLAPPWEEVGRRLAAAGALVVLDHCPPSGPGALTGLASAIEGVAATEARLVVIARSPRVAGLEGVTAFPLGPLSDGDLADLLARLLVRGPRDGDGADHPGVDPSLHAVAAGMGGNPALAVIAARVAGRIGAAATVRDLLATAAFEAERSSEPLLRQVSHWLSEGDAGREAAWREARSLLGVMGPVAPADAGSRLAGVEPALWERLLDSAEEAGWARRDAEALVWLHPALGLVPGEPPSPTRVERLVVQGTRLALELTGPLHGPDAHLAAQRLAGVRPFLDRIGKLAWRSGLFRQAATIEGSLAATWSSLRPEPWPADDQAPAPVGARPPHLAAGDALTERGRRAVGRRRADDRLRALEAAVSAYDAAGERAAAVAPLLLAADMARARGRLSDAAARTADALERAEAGGDLRGAAACCLGWAQVEKDRRRPGAAASWARRALQVHRRARDAVRECETLMLLARIEVQAGCPAAALAWAGSAVERAEGIGGEPLRDRALCTRAAARLVAADAASSSEDARALEAAAMGDLDEAADLLQGEEVDGVVAAGLLAQARLALRIGKPDLADGHAKRVMRGRSSGPDDREGAMWIRGRAADLRGETPRALRWRRQALASQSRGLGPFDADQVTGSRLEFLRALAGWCRETGEDLPSVLTRHGRPHLLADLAVRTPWLHAYLVEVARPDPATRGAEAPRHSGGPAGGGRAEPAGAGAGAVPAPKDFLHPLSWVERMRAGWGGRLRFLDRDRPGSVPPGPVPRTPPRIDVVAASPSLLGEVVDLLITGHAVDVVVEGGRARVWTRDPS